MTSTRDATSGRSAPRLNARYVPIHRPVACLPLPSQIFPQTVSALANGPSLTGHYGQESRGGPKRGVPGGTQLRAVLPVLTVRGWLAGESDVDEKQLPSELQILCSRRHGLPQVSHAPPTDAPPNQAPGVLPHGGQSGQTKEKNAGSERAVRAWFPIKNNHAAVMCSVSTLVFLGGV